MSLPSASLFLPSSSASSPLLLFFLYNFFFNFLFLFFLCHLLFLLIRVLLPHLLLSQLFCFYFSFFLLLSSSLFTFSNFVLIFLFYTFCFVVSSFPAKLLFLPLLFLCFSSLSLYVSFFNTDYRAYSSVVTSSLSSSSSFSPCFTLTLPNSAHSSSLFPSTSLPPLVSFCSSTSSFSSSTYS